MAEGRDLRNKVVFCEEYAFAVGGLNSKAEKFNYHRKQWTTMHDYPIADNLDSWACALTFLPKEYPIGKGAISSSASSGQNVPSGIKDEEEDDLREIMEEEKKIDREIIEEVERY